MPLFKHQKTVSYSPKQMFDLVMDIESYPQFLPWCIDAKIIQILSQNGLIADVVMKFNIFTQKHRSKITTINDNNSYTINIESVSEVFEYLNSKWIFNPIVSGTDINFYMDFKFKSFVFQNLINILLKQVSSQIISKFEERARSIYHI
jgi:coenzyme Q-binding protein COQ10